MHLLFRDTCSVDEQAQAEDLDLDPAPVLVLSFSDSDLSALWNAAGTEPGIRAEDWLRPVRLARLLHPMSVDLFLDRTLRGSRLVLLRLLGGPDYWRYGLDELAAACRREGVALAILPGCEQWHPDFVALSTVAEPVLRRLHGFLRHGGPDNLAACCALLRHLAGLQPAPDTEPRELPPAGLFRAASPEAAPRATVVMYRSHVQSGDTAPFEALGDALAARGLPADLFYVSSLKDREAAGILRSHLAGSPPAVILNATFFSARDGGSEAGTVLGVSDVPVLQLLQPGIAESVWEKDARGLSQADLAMQVVLPEFDGRLPTAPISFKTLPAAGAPFAPARHRPFEPGIALVADRAAGWARLSGAPAAQRRIAVSIPDYPGAARDGHPGAQAGHAVGLDCFASLHAILGLLREAGYDTGAATIPDAAALAQRVLAPLHAEADALEISAAAYRALFAALPASVRDAVAERWGAPPDAAMRFRVLRFGHVSAVLQPERGEAADHRDGYHDPSVPPSHRYLALHLHLRAVEAVHALVQLGAHGTLEWLPGRTAAPGPDCLPSAILRGLPVIYPFICNDPGEAAAARRRLGAAVIAHLPPPLRDAGAHGDALLLEQRIDEYAAADGLDRRRGALLRDDILARAAACGVLRECGAEAEADPDGRLSRLSAWLCDVKELQIRDGLHVFGHLPPHADQLVAAIRRGAPQHDPARIAAGVLASPGRENAALLAALDGRFVRPGPAGAPSRGRPDVLPTGRNPYGLDPRALPTRSALVLAERTVAVLLRRHEQERGEPMRAVLIDLWGSTTLRTGGEDLALALLLLGVRPDWDTASDRCSGFTVTPLAELDRPRVDATLRISGFFRDGFPAQIALFDQAVRTVAARDEPDDWNPLAAARRAGAPLDRIFGAAPNSYGAGIEDRLLRDDWDAASDLAAAFLDQGGWSFGAGGTVRRDRDGFRERIAAVDALVHTQDHTECDLLDSVDLAAHAGGFALAAAALGAEPTVWHADISRADAARIRPLAEQVRLVVRGRAANPRWIAGMMRHGARGAAEIARTVDALHGFAATLPEEKHGRLDAQFELLYAATLADPAVDAFLRGANPRAREAMVARFREAIRRGGWRPRSNAAALDPAG